jgi:hypothetical protein
MILFKLKLQVAYGSFAAEQDVFKYIMIQMENVMVGIISPLLFSFHIRF